MKEKSNDVIQDVVYLRITIILKEHKKADLLNDIKVFDFSADG